MVQIPFQIQELINRFEAQSELYKSPTYNETNLRIDFVNPMFKALGWDIDNTKGYAEAFREVVHEDAIRIGGTIKSPDYSFRIGGRRIFFLEAKKPAVNVYTDVDAAYQLRRYAWTAGLPLSILTNFKEFAVYDCRIKPKFLEKASTARLWYFKHSDYPQKWDEIASVFSPDAIQHGAFDRYIQSHKKSGTEEFDDAFLDEMEDWRKKLASNLALRNDGEGGTLQLDQPGLNFATQHIIDRIVFLRICEDRGVEPPFQLQALLSGDNVYAHMRQLFTKADQRYNSGLFHFQKEKNRDEPPDELTLGLDIDDAALKYIIKRLYYPDSPYVFKEVRADILGSVYERFLGNIIHLTAGHHAKIEPKPEVRKAGGVYYTPTYIVSYIVQNAVGGLLDGRTPNDAARLRILDPACGSGSFLLARTSTYWTGIISGISRTTPRNGLRGKTLRSDPVLAGHRFSLSASASESSPLISMASTLILKPSRSRSYPCCSSVWKANQHNQSTTCFSSMSATAGPGEQHPVRKFSHFHGHLRRRGVE